MWKQLLTIVALLAFLASTTAQNRSRMKPATELPPGYWPLEKSQPIIDKTQTIRLAPQLSHLSEGELKAVAKLLEAGNIFQRLYEKQRHPETMSAYRDLVQLETRTRLDARQSRICSRCIA